MRFFVTVLLVCVRQRRKFMLASAVMITASVAIERARCYTCKAVGP